MNHEWENRSRRTGRTTALVEWAKKNNGVIIFGSNRQAEIATKEYKINAVCLDAFLHPNCKFLEPYVPDTTAFVDALRRAEIHEVNFYRLLDRVQKAPKDFFPLIILASGTEQYVRYEEVKEYLTQLGKPPYS
jgi:hypothetical protein